MKKCDVLIIGAGAAGLTAAVYTSRRNLKTIVVSTDYGGQFNLTDHIENYPAVKLITGQKLAKKFKTQAKKFGAKFINGKVVKISKDLESNKNIFYLDLASGEKCKGKVVILAFGKVPRKLDIPGEEKFMGRGISTCAICDAPLFKNKTVAVIGGYKGALETTFELANIAKKVYLVHKKENLTADQDLIDKVKQLNNVEFILNHIPVEVIGDKVIKSLKIKHVNNNEIKEIDLDGIFIEIGYMVDTGFVKDLVKLNEDNEIVIDNNCKTSTEGIFAAGDVTIIPYKQIVISAGEGAKAALEAYKYLTNSDKVEIDWTY